MSPSASDPNWTAAVRFMRWQAFLLAICVAGYGFAHWWIPAAGTFPSGKELIHLDRFGLATIVSAEDVDWYVGADKSVPLLAQMNERNKNIQARLGGLRQQIRDLADQLTEEAAAPVRGAFDRGEFEYAALRLGVRHAGLAPASLTAVHDGLNTIESSLRELAELKRQQEESLPLFSAPEKFKLFWANPWGILCEVIWWSLFGLFASLLFHSARFARQGEFDPSETIVGWTKIGYTPIIAIVLVLAIAQGLLHVSSAGTRIWMIPLFGFLAGFNSRKAARVVNGLSEWTLGRMATLLNDGNEDETSSGIAAISGAMLPPSSFEELGDQAKQTADSMLANEIGQKIKST